MTRPGNVANGAHLHEPYTFMIHIVQSRIFEDLFDGFQLNSSVFLVKLSNAKRLGVPRILQRNFN